MNSDETTSKTFGTFSALLVALSCFILLGPIVEGAGYGGKIYKFGFSVLLIVSLLVARENSKIFGVAIVLVVLNLVDKWAHSFDDIRTADIVSLATGSLYLCFVCWTLVRSLLRQHETTLDTVLGGINVYLIMAVAFMLAHIMIERITPGSYESRGMPITEWVLEQPLLEDGADPFTEQSVTENMRMTTTFLYFSFATLTTLGYGDIVPARPMAQTLASAEAVIGQMFVAIFIGGLVAQHISAVQERRRGAS